jgi:hypothetical protein
VKIYIETEMTELPIICKKCKRFQDKGVGYCTGIMDWTNYFNETRPSWCPLRTETEIAEQYGKEE